MTRAAALSSINCTQCGAGLSVLGGGRVRSQICGYCGAVLDAQDNFKILQSIGKRDHPASPARIGMALEINGVEFTIIGTLGLEERWNGQVARWVEHQVFSPTHGYGWLAYEQGHFTFTRKIRDYDPLQWLTASTVENSESRPTRKYGGKTYRYYESTAPEIVFMEGEFNYLPELGPTKPGITLLGPDAMVTLRRGRGEQEAEKTVLLPRAAALADLGVDPKDAPIGKFHPLQPYEAGKHEFFMRRALSVFCAVCLVGALAFAGFGRDVLNRSNIDAQSLPQTYDFEVSSTDHLVEVEFFGDLSNAWAVLSAEVLDPDGNPVALGERLVERYSGRTDGEDWSEGSRRATFRFRPEMVGVHEITVEVDEMERWPNPGIPRLAVDLRVREHVSSSFYMLIAALVFGIGALFFRAKSLNHLRKRMAGSDWTDED